MSKIPQEAIEAGARAIWERSPCEVAFDEAVKLSKPLVQWALSDAKVCIEAADAARAQGAEVAVKQLDLSNLLRHAFISGFEKMGGTITSAIGHWPNYDPEECEGYERVCSALTTPPAPQPTEREKVLEEVFAAAVYVLREHRSTYDLHRSDLQARGKANAHFYKALVDVCDSIEEGMRSALAGEAPSQTDRAEGGE